MDVKELLRELDLISIAEQELDLDNRSKKTSGSLRASCPFHEGKNKTSLLISEHRYYCFVCQTAGDAIGFIMDLKKINFIEAYDYLNENYLGGKFERKIVSKKNHRPYGY